MNRGKLIELRKEHIANVKRIEVEKISDSIAKISKEYTIFIDMLITALTKADIKIEKQEIDIQSFDLNNETINRLDNELTVSADEIERLKDLILEKDNRIKVLEEGREKEVVTINTSDFDIEHYECRDALLTSLEYGGVDNWGNYGDSQGYYEEFLKENYPKTYAEEFGD